MNKEYFKFFSELEKNNHKEWFDKNRKRYKKEIKEPFNDLVRNLIAELAMIDPKLSGLEPKRAVFRINRDIRFSNDKTPYKTHMGAIISPKGKKDKTHPGMYFEINKSGANIFGGVYQPDKDQLKSIREKLASGHKKFREILNEKQFKKHYNSEILGEKNKRLPKEFKEAADDEELIYNKSFYYASSLTKKEILDNDLKDLLVIKFMAAKPVNDWFANALGVD